jgi:hypothetical protein
MNRILIPLLAIMAIGCSKSELTAPDANLPIMPLAVGNRWIGRSLTLDTNGNVTTTRYDTLQIRQEFVSDSERWFLTGTIGPSYTNRSDGLWSLPYTSGPTASHPFLYAKHPASVGDLFNSDTVSDPFTVPALIGATRVAATGMEMTVPAGTYHVTKYQSQFRTFDGRVLTGNEIASANDYYAFAPGVGLIKEESYMMAPGGRAYVGHRWELIEATLK